MYADFNKFQVNELHESLVDAAFYAGVAYKKAGNKKLPRFTEVAGQKFPVVGSLGDVAQSFVKGWKSVN